MLEQNKNIGIPFDDCGHLRPPLGMVSVSIRDAKNHLTQLARRVGKGEIIVVMRNGRPVFDLAPHKPPTGPRFDALSRFKREHDLDRIAPFIAEDFDAPLPEDFLLRALPADV